jgi:hypothetical protein
VFNLRRAMGIVAGAVADLDHVTRSRQLTARQIWLEARATVKDANRRIKQMTGKGMTPKPYHQNFDVG